MTGQRFCARSRRGGPPLSCSRRSIGRHAPAAASAGSSESSCRRRRPPEMFDNEQRASLIALVEEKQDDESFQEAKRFLEEALAKGEDADLLREYAYIHECRGGAFIREALRWYERSIQLDPSAENVAHGQLITAHARLLQVSDAIDLYKARLAAAPENVTEYRYLAQAYLLGGEHEEAGKVVDAGLGFDPNDRHLLEARGS